MKQSRFIFLAILLFSLIFFNACNDSSSSDVGNLKGGTTLPGGSPSAAIPPPMPQIVSFESSKSCVRPGEQVDLTWEVKDGGEVYIQDNLVENSGHAPFIVTSEGSITLTVRNATGAVHREVPVYLKDSSITYYLSKEPYLFNPIQLFASSLSDPRVLILSNGNIYRGSLQHNFTQLHPNDAVTNWSALAIDPLNSSILYAATLGRVYRSTDGGATWPGVIPIRNLGSDMSVNTVVPSSTSPGIVYVGFVGGIYRVNLNTNPGSMTLLSGLNGQDVRSIAEIKNSLIVATSSTSNLYISHDMGDSWNSFSNPSGRVLNVLTGNAEHLFAGTDSGLYEIDSSSPSMNLIQTFGAPIRHMRFDPSGILYIAAANGFSKYENGNYKKLVSDSIDWILNPSTQEVLTPQGLMQLEEGIVYSEYCPNQN